MGADRVSRDMMPPTTTSPFGDAQAIPPPQSVTSRPTPISTSPTAILPSAVTQKTLQSPSPPTTPITPPSPTSHPSNIAHRSKSNSSITSSTTSSSAPPSGILTPTEALNIAQIYKTSLQDPTHPDLNSARSSIHSSSTSLSSLSGGGGTSPRSPKSKRRSSIRSKASSTASSAVGIGKIGGVALDKAMLDSKGVLVLGGVGLDGRGSMVDGEGILERGFVGEPGEEEDDFDGPPEDEVEVEPVE
ncbi:hypothetical protein HDV05_007618 [Chytridiales sp. JEL 0842]|nr:hypothetical protein HDV05_007618 [Chytridiales sp. JEL 0842]